jgi:hypothetical protein
MVGVDDCDGSGDGELEAIGLFRTETRGLEDKVVTDDDDCSKEGPRAIL